MLTATVHPDFPNDTIPAAGKQDASRQRPPQARSPKLCLSLVYSVCSAVVELQMNLKESLSTSHPAFWDVKHIVINAKSQMLSKGLEGVLYAMSHLTSGFRISIFNA